MPGLVPGISLGKGTASLIEMAGDICAKTRFALLPGHDKEKKNDRRNQT